MRILIFHGYLLDGTGSNVYNARLAPALARLGHEVHLCCQDRHPETYPFVDASADWEGGALQIRTLREPVRCTVYRPPIGSLLPVYVADRYEGFDARPYGDCTDEQIDFYVRRNVDAVREVAELVRPDVALANHLIMGPLILARALADTDVPYAVKVHGSALEYTVKVHPDRFLAPARDGVAPARCVLVGSAHTAASLWAALSGDDELVARTRLGPPGVDIDEFAPRTHDAAAAGVRALARRLAERAASAGGPARPGTAAAAGGDAAGPGDAAAGGGVAGRDDASAGGDVAGRDDASAGGDAFARDDAAAAAALARLDPERDRLIVFVGKLIVSKGVDLLLAAFPLVLEAAPDARLVVVGFGAFREGLEQLVAALTAGDLERVAAIALRGRELEGGAPAPLRYLLAFLNSLAADTTGRRERYLAAAAALADRVVFTGRLAHEELADLLPACAAQVVPSTFPEAFGMVAAEAAACGALPVSADHSGLAEVTSTLAAAVPPPAAPWLSFPLGPDAVPELAQRLIAWLGADDALRAATREALATTARRDYSWEGVARGVLAAAQGDLATLISPLQPGRALG